MIQYMTARTERLPAEWSLPAFPFCVFDGTKKLGDEGFIVALAPTSAIADQIADALNGHYPALFSDLTDALIKAQVLIERDIIRDDAGIGRLVDGVLVRARKVVSP